MAKVFLSHATHDRPAVDTIRGWLTAAGHEVFFDQDTLGITVGERWEAQLYERLRWADAVVCVVTSAFAASTWTAAEIGVARSRGSRILPIVAEVGAAHPLLASLQHIDMVSDPGRARIELLGALQRSEVGAGWADGRSPYPGLRPFDATYEQTFFGRTSELRELASRLREPSGDAGSALLVIGPSGIGKSSLIRAGLLPQLAFDMDWLVLEPFTPGADPISSLVRAITITANRAAIAWTPSAVRDRLTDKGLTHLTDDLLISGGPARRRLLVVIDQLEELLTVTAAAERSRFLELLGSVSDASVRVIGTLRADFLDSLLSSAVFPAAVYPLSPLSRSALRQVVAQPAQVAGIELEEGLVDRLIDDTGNGEAISLLAYTLAQLAEGVVRGGQLTFSRYEALGGVRGTLNRQADNALSEAVAVSGRTPQSVLTDLLRLITLDDHGRAVRQQIRREELPDSVRTEFDAFVARRLLSIDIDVGDVVVTLTHEALLTWPPLVDAISKQAAALRARGQIERAANEWNSAARHRDWLWQGARLSEVMAVLGVNLQGGRLIDNRVELTPAARQFLQASLDRRRWWPRRSSRPDDTAEASTASSTEAETSPDPEESPALPPDAPPIGVDPLSEVVSDAESAEDRLGVTDDVRAIARMVAALNTRPPLSIALLGNWGSGKSSFMRQVIAWVDALADASKADPKTSRYAANVRQVRFNAWHYSDDHLWVGLVEHMFRELADHKRDPNSELERHDLQNKLTAEAERLRLLREGIKSVDAVPAKKGWLGGLLQPFRLMRLLRAVSRDVREEIRSPARLATGLLLVLLGVGLVVAFTLLGEPAVGWITGLVAAATGMITPVVEAWQRGEGLADRALATLRQKQKDSEDAIRSIEDRLDLIDPARRLRSLLVEISAGDRYERYRGLTGRIQHDLDRLSTDLAAAQEHWASGAPDAPLPVQRIVLYIDDLDRCSSARVVDVLQAINLLLSMTLFVVVVAVDPRWLLDALEDHHRHLLVGRRGVRAAEGRARSLDYLDKIFHIPYAVRPMGEDFGGTYLSSLLPPPDPDEPEPAADDGQPLRAPQPPSGARHSPQDLADDARPLPAAATTSTAPDADVEDPDPPPPIPSPGPMEAEQTARPPRESLDDLGADDPGVGRTTSPVVSEPPIDLAEVKAEPEPDRDIEDVSTPIDLTGRELRLWSTEREFLPLLSPMLPTPRAVKKLANLYRLVRVSVPPDRLAAFVGGRRGGPYQAVALLLATIVGSPGETRPFLLALSAAPSDPHSDIVDLLVDLPDTRLAPMLAEHIRAIRKLMPVHGEVAAYCISARRVSRFSFETYQLFRETYGS